MDQAALKSIATELLGIMACVDQIEEYVNDPDVPDFLTNRIEKEAEDSRSHFFDLCKTISKQLPKLLEELKEQTKDDTDLEGFFELFEQEARKEMGAAP